MQGQISATYVRLLGEALAARGLDPAALPGVAMAVAQDHDDGLARVAVADWARMLAAAAATVGEPAFGLAVGARIRPDHFGLLGYRTLCCATLGEALARLADYERLVYDVNPLRLSPTADGIRLEWGDERGRPGQLVDECAIAALLSYARDLVGRPALAPTQVRFINAAPADLEPYHRFFCCPVTFAAATTVVELPATALSLPLRAPDAALGRLLDAQAALLLQRLPPADDLERQLRAVIARLLRDGSATLAGCAPLLHCSERTLQRRLAARGTSFQQALDGTRRALALAWLDDRRLRIAEIAELLGYADQAAFTRAFRRWTGGSPRRYRQRGDDG